MCVVELVHMIISWQKAYGAERRMKKGGGCKSARNICSARIASCVFVFCAPKLLYKLNIQVRHAKRSNSLCDCRHSTQHGEECTLAGCSTSGGESVPSKINKNHCHTKQCQQIHTRCINPVFYAYVLQRNGFAAFFPCFIFTVYFDFGDMIYNMRITSRTYV